MRRKYEREYRKVGNCVNEYVDVFQGCEEKRERGGERENVRERRQSR